VALLFSLACFLGAIVGLRTFLGPAALSWAARSGWLALDGTWLALLGHSLTPWLLTGLAALELVTDKLPMTPSRTMPPAFGARIASGLLCGAAIGADAGAIWPGAVAGGVGAVIGTLGGRAMRARMADAFRKDFPAAVIEDLIAIAGAAFSAFALR
jgi:uncharacterized membrane protein